MGVSSTWSMIASGIHRCQTAPPRLLSIGSIAKAAGKGHQLCAISAADGSMGTKMIARTRPQRAERLGSPLLQQLDERIQPGLRVPG